MFQVIRRRRGPSCAPAASSDRSREALKWAATAIIDKQRTVNKSLAHISGGDVLPIEDGYRQQQNAEDVSAADASVASKTLPGVLGLEHIAPEVHVGGEEIWPQVLKELNAVHDMEHKIQSQSCYGCRCRIIEEH